MLDDTIHLLVVDDDDVDRERIRRMLSTTDLKADITEADSVENAMRLLQARQFQCVIIDYRLGKQDGLILLEAIRSELKLHCAVVMITGLGDEEVAANALRLGASDYLQKKQIQPIQLLSSITNAVHRSAVEQKMYSLAHFDDLTGLINRPFFLDRLHQRLLQMSRDNSLSALCFIDLDNFKPVNDMHGHDAGDHVLRKIAERLTRVLRASDSIARLGGDEFVILLTNLTTSQQALELANGVQHEISKQVELPADNLLESSVTVSASIGVTIINDASVDAEVLLRQADQSMYAAKRGGKNRIVIFDPAEEAKRQSLLKFYDEIDMALLNNEFVLHYQPQVDMRNNTVTGLEALIRWQHPDKGLLLPAAFIVALEDPVIGTKIGEWVIRRALTQLTDWNSIGLTFCVSINIAAPHFLRPDFVSRLSGLLNSYPEVISNQLELEILESVSICDIHAAIDSLSACRSMGVRVALDDFGTGYSSLRYLKSLPLDKVKIDRSFIKNIDTSKDDLAIVKSIVLLAENFGYFLVAEGVESEEHGKLLVAHHCFIGQGFSIAYPMPPEKLAEWMNSRTVVM